MRVDDKYKVVTILDGLMQNVSSLKQPVRRSIQTCHTVALNVNEVENHNIDDKLKISSASHVIQKSIKIL